MAAVRVRPAPGPAPAPGVVTVRGAVLRVLQRVGVDTRLVEGVDEDPHHHNHDQVPETGGGLGGIVTIVRVVAVTVALMPTEPSAAAAAVLLAALLGQLQRVLEAAAAREDEVVLRVVVPLAHDLHPAEPGRALHVRLALPLHLAAVPAPVVALHHRRLQATPTATPSHAAQLGHGGAPPPCRHLSGSQC